MEPEIKEADEDERKGGFDDEGVGGTIECAENELLPGIRELEEELRFLRGVEEWGGIPELEEEKVPALAKLYEGDDVNVEPDFLEWGGLKNPAHAGPSDFRCEGDDTKVEPECLESGDLKNPALTGPAGLRLPGTE